jgi:hypothetical protein
LIAGLKLLTTKGWEQVPAVHVTIQYNTDILFPIKEPFRAEQLTKNLIQWLWIDYIDWKMTTFYETQFKFHVCFCQVLVNGNVKNEGLIGNCRRHVSDVCTSDFGHVGHAM